jgi:hypothetical protein
VPVTVRRRASFVSAAALLVALAVATSAPAHPPAPTSKDQALSDGCQRSDFGIGFDSTPEWVYVHRSAAIRMARGTVRVSHASLQDSILQHRSFDYNGNLVPDGPFRYLIAGRRASGTNNYAAEEGEARGRLHFEWESATLPFFAWPTDGDRATLWGSWIWDCGHWTSTANNTGGTITGEHTELHPLSAIAVNRRASYLSSSGERETDVFISNEGDGAHAVEHCALSHHPVSGGAFPSYDSGYSACARSVPNRIQPLARSYSFFVPAPPKPSPTALLRYRILTRVGGSSGVEQFRRAGNGIAVTVKLHNSKRVVRYGKSFFLSWSGATHHPPSALKVTLKSILIKHADPNPAVPDPSGAHWSLYLDVNGYWQLLNKWAPRLTAHVVDGERIAINRTVKIDVPRRAGVSFLVQGRECDAPAGKTVVGVHTNLLYPCPANTDEQNPNIFDVFNNDDPGTILSVYRSASAALGTHVARSAATVNFRGSGRTSFGDGVQGQGDYQLTYTIRRG